MNAIQKISTTFSALMALGEMDTESEADRAARVLRLRFEDQAALVGYRKITV